MVKREYYSNDVYIYVTISYSGTEFGRDALKVKQLGKHFPMSNEKNQRLKNISLNASDLDCTERMCPTVATLVLTTEEQHLLLGVSVLCNIHANTS